MESKSNLDKIVDTEKLMANQARYEKDAKDLLTVFVGQVNMLYNQAEEGFIALPNCFFAAVSKRDIA